MPATFAAHAAPGLWRAMEPDSVFAEPTTNRSIHEAYNEALEHFAAVDGLEALVLLHEDTELLDADFRGYGDKAAFAAADAAFRQKWMAAAR